MQRQGKSRSAPVTPEQAFAAALREIRTEKNISQEALGFGANYHRTYISLLERGKMNPSLRTMLSIAAVLEVPAADLVKRVEGHLGGPWKRQPDDADPRRA